MNPAPRRPSAAALAALAAWRPFPPLAFAEVVWRAHRRRRQRESSRRRRNVGCWLGASWLWWPGSDRVSDTLALVVVPAVQDRDQVRGVNQSGFLSHGQRRRVVDVFRSVQ